MTTGENNQWRVAMAESGLSMLFAKNYSTARHHLYPWLCLSMVNQLVQPQMDRTTRNRRSACALHWKCRWHIGDMA